MIQETGVATAPLPPDIYVRSVAANSHVVSYWRTPNGILPNPIHPNTFHFTLGPIVGETAHFHATDLGNNSVTYYKCSVNPATGLLVVTHDQNNPGNVGANGAQARAQGIAPMIYRAVFVDDVAFKQELEERKAAQRTHWKTNIASKRSVLGVALKSANMGTKPKPTKV